MGAPAHHAPAVAAQRASLHLLPADLSHPVQRQLPVSAAGRTRGGRAGAPSAASGAGVGRGGKAAVRSLGGVPRVRRAREPGCFGSLRWLKPPPTGRIWGSGCGNEKLRFGGQKKDGTQEARLQGQTRVGAPSARPERVWAALRFPARPSPAGTPALCNPRGPHGLATLRRGARTHPLPAHTLAHTCTLSLTGQHLRCPQTLLRLLAPSRCTERPDPSPGLLLTWARGDRAVRAAGGRGASRCPGQGGARSLGARVSQAGQRPSGSGKLPAGPGWAQRAEGARRRSGGFARLLMGRICSGLRFKKKFDLWNRCLGEFKLDATD